MQLASFLEFLQDQAGEALRGVAWYRDREAELIYLRDDLDLEAVQSRVTATHKALTWDLGPPTPTELDTLGAELATVSVRESAVLVHLPVEQRYGVVVGLEPDAVQSVHDFVGACRETLIDADSASTG